MPFVITHESEDGSTQIEELDGISWADAPIPRRWHKCAPQTKGWLNYFTQVFRCACGAIARVDGGELYWMEKNSRRKKG